MYLRFRRWVALITLLLALCLQIPAAPLDRSDAARQLCSQFSSEPLPASCLPGLTSGRRIHSLIATVADPKRTNLALYFDRSVESLIWAFGDIGYAFQSYWLPWDTGEFKRAEAPTELSRDAKEQPGEQVKAPGATQDEPGFLLFRGSLPDEFFVVWLVGESPTQGIETRALEKAIDNTRVLDPDAATVRIIGPSFSGSFPSLAQVLNSKPVSASVITGMATSLDAQRSFVARVPASKLKEFKATVENASYSLSRFVAYLQHHWGNAGEIAILAEDQTAYGQAMQSYLWSVVSKPPATTGYVERAGLSAERWLLLRFPREIARLRDTYETEAGKPAAAPKQTPQPEPSENLSFTLRSPGEGADNVPEFSGKQGPLSQEAVLLDLANSLQHEHVRYAGIIATDVLDQIFLVRFLQHACPDVRLVLFDADLLFARAELITPLEGVLNVTTYPLFLRNQHWTEAQLSGRLPQRVPFASRSAEGVYNAARAQLWYGGFHGEGEVMLDYFHPDKNPAWHPPLWLTVLGRTGYWPVALLDEEPISEQANHPASSLMQSPVAEKRSEERLHPEAPSRGWTLAILLLSALGLLHCLYFWFVFRPQQRNPMAFSKGPENPFCKALYVLFGFYPPGAKPMFNRLLLIVILAFAAAELVLTTSGVPYFLQTGTSGTAEAFYFGFPLVCLILLIIVAVQLSWGITGIENIVFPWFLWLVFVGLWLLVVSGSEFDNMRVYFFAYRMLQPSSGSSPGPPVLLLVAVPAVWGFVQLIREAGLDIPQVPELPEALPNAAKLSDWLNQVVPRIFLGYAVVLLLMLLWNRLHSIEDRSYDLLVNLLVMLGYFLMFSIWTQLFITWRYLRRFLESLERLPLRDAFSRMPKELGTLPLLRKGRQKPFVLASSRCLETLTAFSNNPIIAASSQTAVDYGMRAADGKKYLDQLLSLRRGGKAAELYNYIAVSEAKNRLEQIILRTADSLAAFVQEKFWREGKSESVELEEESDKRQKLGRLDEKEKAQILAEEFIALRVVMYILHILRHMHKLMWFVVSAFVLTVIAMNVYPFKSPRLIDFSSIAIFVVLALGTMTVLAQMDRNSIISRLTATTPDEIGKNFFLRAASYGVLPLITVLSTQFPSIRNLLFSWVQPALQALSSSG